jgi:biopolymer transport protein TolR
MNDINVTPLIDVMLVLLVIFMVTAPLLATGVHVELPKVKSAPMQMDDAKLLSSSRRTSTSTSAKTRSPRPGGR